MSDNVFGVLRHNLERAKKSRPYSIVLKMTNTCNLDCTYCYVSHDNARFLKKEYVEKLFDELMIYDYQSACCVFHGGEPLICYREINEIISLLKRKEYGDRISFDIQTNGTILNDSIIQMIKTNNISVGISLDGPKHVHDIYRKYKDGRGSFDVVMNNLNKLTHEKIRCGFLSVVCDETLAQLIETVKWFSNIGITYIDIKPYFQSDDRVTLSVEKYAQKMLELLNWLKENPNRIYVREFDTFANAICGNKKKMSMCDKRNCWAGRDHITMDCNGDIYLCDRLLGYQMYVLGNIEKEHLDEILSNPLISQFNSRKFEDVGECNVCEVKHICNMGCAATNLLENNNDFCCFSKTAALCEYYKVFIGTMRQMYAQDVDALKIFISG